ncbi:MAG: head maturation protease, ClpP-related [Syntrophomonadaceae bacterium]
MPKVKKPYWTIKAATENKPPELLLYGEIANELWWGDETTPKQLAEDLKSLGDIDELIVRINSPGGNVFAGQTIYSLLKSHKAKITVYIDGLAASAASVVAMAGDEIIMPRNAMMMIHNPWLMAMGDSRELRKAADMLDQVRETIIVAYQSKAVDMEKDKLIELMDDETWMTADEALEYGFIDKVDEANQAAASIKGDHLVVNGLNFDLSRYQNRPKLPENKPKEEEQVEITLEILTEKAPELLAQIKQQAHNEGKETGIKEERERFKALADLEAPGCEEILNKARYETGETPDQIAVSLVAVLKKQRTDILDAARNDAAALNGIDVGSQAATDGEQLRNVAGKIAKAANERRGER